MDNTSKYIQTRKQIINDIKTEFCGPSVEDEIVTGNPVTRYASSMLFPYQYELRGTKGDSNDVNDEALFAASSTHEIDSTSANSFYPSVLAVSFYCNGENPELIANVSTAIYQKLEQPSENFVEVTQIPDKIIEHDDFKDNFEYKEGKLIAKTNNIEYRVPEVLTDLTEDKELQNKLYKVTQQSHDSWKRIPVSNEVTLTSPSNQIITEGLELFYESKYDKEANATLCTVGLKNTNKACSGLDEGHVFFQCELSIYPKSSDSEFREYLSKSFNPTNEEDKSLALLFRKKVIYAVGHGCAVNWEIEPANNKITKIYSQSLPTYEVPQVAFDIPNASDTANKALNMHELAGKGELKDRDIISSLNEFISYYESWIKDLHKRKDIPEQYKEIAAKNISRCEETLARMQNGIKTLSTNNESLRAFKLANQAMMMQNLYSNFQKKKKQDNEEFKLPDIDSENSKKANWRPFQLAFLLLNINSVVDDNSAERKLVDLIWFPTGGGKTEAYLGVSAFTIIYRRIKYKEQGNGTAIMMRYTLRLLTNQQFQRACTLICALELIRKAEVLPGNEINIGLWIGSDSTPNEIDDCLEKFNRFIVTGVRNPSPIRSCPWCGTSMETKVNNRRHYGLRPKTQPRKTIELYCLQKECPFNGRLPIYFVDDDIYSNQPTLLFGTVDKFAMMPWKGNVAKIFALNEGNNNRSPDLIIQDELHLISGALGTMVGIYETAIDYLGMRKGSYPKIISSTATVRRASEQCLNLFNREVRQFPPPAIDITDSFFAKEVPLSQQNGRFYIGIMPSGKTQTTAAVRLTSAVLRSVTTLEAIDSVKDKYWTLVSYFNSIRELGGFISLINDDIPGYLKTLRYRYGDERIRPIYNKKELWSRTEAEQIPQILQELSEEYPSDNSIDVLAATNMISVGIDVDRLNIMSIRGQPKMTSEYIQVSSRVGRKYPGLVVTLYNSARTRDRAYYERFVSYHDAMQRFVEPTSITPFSRPARLRALHAILITIIRHGLNNSALNKDNGAEQFSLDMDGLNEIKQYILNRAKNIDSREFEGLSEDLNKDCQDWVGFIEKNDTDVVYSNASGAAKPLMYPIGKTAKGLWATPQSMRNVDVDVAINFEDE